jgi:FKBP-type peptidyl-prolyl cis-trans isomerase FklB
MKHSWLKVTTLALTLSAINFSYAGFFGGPTLNTDTDKVSYSIGYDIGNNFKSQNINIETDQFEAGLKDGLNGKTPAMSPEQMQTTLMNFQKQMMQKSMQQQQEVATKNLAASQAYLQKIAAQPGVQQLAPGLYYKVITAGTGKMPSAKDIVTVNYEGTLPDGTLFDSSYKRNQPATFQVNQVIPGWSKTLPHMRVGSTWMVYMAPDLAYGTYAPPQIGPNQALTFKIELLSIGKPSGK